MSLLSRKGSSVVMIALGVTCASTAVWATYQADKKCYETQCGGYLDQVCEGTGSCSFCSGGPTAEKDLCFNRPTSICTLSTGSPFRCGVVTIGTCVSGSCTNSSGTTDDCTQAGCLGGEPP